VQFPSRFAIASGIRSAVVWIAMVACAMRWLVCPLPEAEAEGSVPTAAYQQGLAAPVQSLAAEHPDSDFCCQLLSDSNSMAAPLAVVSSTKGMMPSILIAVAAMMLLAAADPLVKLIPTSNGPPRGRYLRFATFWSHAPPAAHA